MQIGNAEAGMRKYHIDSEEGNKWADAKSKRKKKSGKKKKTQCDLRPGDSEPEEDNDAQPSSPKDSRTTLVMEAARVFRIVPFMCEQCPSLHTGESSCQCGTCHIPAGTLIRGPRLFKVDGTTYTRKHPHCIFLVHAHNSPWCALHFLMHVSELLFQPLQDLIVSQLTDKE
eukprot:3809099-Rhodomonas_salina.1